MLWNALLDSSQVAELKTRRAARHRPIQAPKLWDKFNRIWFQSLVLAYRNGLQVIWSSTGPLLKVFT